MHRAIFLRKRLLKGSRKTNRQLVSGSGKSRIIPLVLLGAGVAMLLVEEKSVWSKYSFQQRFFTPSRRSRSYAIESYLRFVPIALVYLLDRAGCKAKHAVTERNLILLKGLVLQGVVVALLKRVIPMERPNGKRHSFPSSHTARAFVIASFMQHEYGQRSAWFTATAYSFAFITAALRLRYSHHWWPDVLVGAGVGMLIMQLTYASRGFSSTHRMRPKKADHVECANERR